MEDLLTSLLGFAMIYSWVHFVLIQHNRTYAKRTDWEKIVTWFAIVAFVLYVFGTM